MGIVYYFWQRRMICLYNLRFQRETWDDSMARVLLAPIQETFKKKYSGFNILK